jgi:hypothetical protein
VVVAEGGRAVHRVLLRILCLTGCALGFAFLLALFAPSSGTAHAAAAPADDSTLAPEAALWSDPSSLSATAARRAVGDEARSAPLVATPVASDRPLTPPSTGLHAPAGIAPLTVPVGTSAAGGSGTPDAGPSIAQIAVLAAALVGVRWLSQRLRASELSWRNALITLSIERPG